MIGEYTYMNLASIFVGRHCICILYVYTVTSFAARAQRPSVVTKARKAQGEPTRDAKSPEDRIFRIID